MEYISFHRHIRNTPSDTEVHAEHQLRADRSIGPEEKNIQNHVKLGRMKELGWGGDRSVSRTGPVLGGGRGWTEAGV